MAKSGSGQVIQAGGGDVLLFNSAGGDEGPGGILVPAKVAGKITLGEGDMAWQQGLKLVEQGRATAIPVSALGELSEGLTAITLLMPGKDNDAPRASKPRTSFMRPAPKKAKAPARGKKK